MEYESPEVGVLLSGASREPGALVDQSRESDTPTKPRRKAGDAPDQAREELAGPVGINCPVRPIENYQGLFESIFSLLLGSTRLCLHTYIHTYMHAYIHQYIRMFVYKYLCMYIYMYIPHRHSKESKTWCEHFSLSQDDLSSGMLCQGKIELLLRNHQNEILWGVPYYKW